ncbi:carbohydrate ABC transporter permease [Candidatus Hydrogenedentota bacterium]
MRGTRFTFRQFILVLVLVVLVFLTLLPFYGTVLSSQKTNGEILNRFWSMPDELHPDYITKAFKYIHRYILNSLVICVCAVSGVVFLSSLSGYVFARIDFPGKRLLFMLILSLMMVPGLLTLIPAFLWYKGFPFVGGNDWLGAGGHGFLDTRLIMIIPFIAGGQVLGIFLCRTFFETIPSSVFEAARIDGASEFQAYWHIGLPLSLPILATLSIMTFVGVYNDYIWPLITIGDDAIQVFSVGVTKFQGEGNLQYGPIMSGFLIGSIPLIIVFAFGMKYYVEGLTKGAIKA